jgi:hypothetical protein
MHIGDDSWMCRAIFTSCVPPCCPLLCRVQPVLALWAWPSHVHTRSHLISAVQGPVLGLRQASWGGHSGRCVLCLGALSNMVGVAI